MAAYRSSDTGSYRRYRGWIGGPCLAFQGIVCTGPRVPLRTQARGSVPQSSSTGLPCAQPLPLDPFRQCQSGEPWCQTSISTACLIAHVAQPTTSDNARAPLELASIPVYYALSDRDKAMCASRSLEGLLRVAATSVLHNTKRQSETILSLCRISVSTTGHEALARLSREGRVAHALQHFGRGASLTLAPLPTATWRMNAAYRWKPHELEASGDTAPGRKCGGLAHIGWGARCCRPVMACNTQ